MKHLSVPVAVGSSDSVRAYFGMAQTVDTALPVSFPRGQAWISLDPALTSPNVLVGVVGLDRPALLTPGRVLPIPQDCTSLRFYNVHHATLGNLEFGAVTGGNAYHRGRVGIVVGTADELPAWIASLKRLAPSPKLGVIYQETGRGVDATVGQSPFPISNLSGLRVAVSPEDVGGALMDAPADFQVVLRPETAMLGLVRPPDALGLGLDSDPLDRAASPAITPGKWPNSDLDVTFTQTKRTHDFEILTPAPSMRWMVVSIAGAGVTTVAISCEGRY